MSDKMSDERLAELETVIDWLRPTWRRDALRELVAEVRRAREENDQLRAELAGWKELDDPAVDERARYPDIVVQLTGKDGNAFYILAAVTTAMRSAGLPQEVRNEFRKQATSGDYEHLLRTCVDWVTVR